MDINFNEQDCILKIIPKVFDLEKGEDILWIDDEAIQNVNIIENDSKKYDYIIVSSCFETLSEKSLFIGHIRNLLKENGTLFLTLNNPLGLRYLVGDKDPYTFRNFDSVESYLRVNQYDRNTLKGQMADRADIDMLVMKAGFNKPIQFSVFPCLEYPQLIYREDMLPNEDISSRIIPMYNSPDTVFLDEYSLLKKFMKNGLFHQFVNAYILECSLDERYENIVHATININRGNEKSMSTVIREDGTVCKAMIFPEGMEQLKLYEKNHNALRSNGVNAVAVDIADGAAKTEFIDGVGGIDYFRELFKCASREDFIAKVDEFRDIILKSSEQYIDTDTGEVILKTGYPDLTLINCIYKDDTPYIIDQEYVIGNLPAKVLITRLVDYVYFGNTEMEKAFPRRFFDERYNLGEDLGRWRRYIAEFMFELKNENELRPFYEKHCTNPDIINANRQRMNYSQEEYKKLFDDIFADVDGRELYLFGSGLFAERFINLYGRFFDIKGIIDNNAEKWGTTKSDIEILPPEQIFKKDPSEYKIIVCIKNYNAVLCQLKAAGVKNISVFDPNAIYDLKRGLHKTPDLLGAVKDDMESCLAEDAKPEKKYNVGYIAGVFDLFHIGHLNLLRRAKEQCNHLIVGVVNDEAVIKNKRVEPFVPFEERIEMVRACKYVDEAVEITYTNAGTRDAFRLYHFDVQFSGSDYVNNGNWLAVKEFLEKHGSELVFFPYTEQTSSSKIKRLIDEKLM